MKKTIIIITICFGVLFANEKFQQENLEVKNENVNSEIHYEYSNNHIKAKNSVPLSEKYMEIQDYLSRALPAVPFSNSLYAEDCVIYEAVANNIVSSVFLILQNLGYEVAVIKDKFQPNEISTLFYSEDKEKLQNVLSSFAEKMPEDKKIEQKESNNETNNEESNKEENEVDVPDIVIFNNTQELIQHNNLLKLKKERENKSE